MSEENEEQTDEYANMFCPSCCCRQLSYKLKNGNWKCDVCGREFSEEESEDEENTQIEEKEIF